MENLIKCSSIKHSEINALYYCQECNVYMCNKCSNFHSELLSNHHIYELGKDKKEIFTGLCKEKEHKIELKFYCKTHNVLCCAACITKIKGEGNGQHTDCDVCFIKDIEKEKRTKLKESIKYLEEFSNEIENSINELKKLYEKINEDKEELKMKVSNIFTKIRNSINEREDELLSDIDKEYNNFLFKEDIIKQNEKIPNKIKSSLEIGKEIDNKWNEKDKLKNINDSINIENEIIKIKMTKENLNKSFLIKDLEFNFEEEDKINKFLEEIKNFGKIIKENKLYISNLDSSLIINNNKEYIKILKNWINPNKNLKSELLYRLSRDGKELSKFHELCDDKGPTLTLFQIDDGNKGGIYTPLSWDTKSHFKKDKETFMFNLNKNEKYKKIDEKNASIFCTKDYGPWTYSFGFYKDNSMKKIEHIGSRINAAYENGSNILLNNSTNSKCFDVIDVEVYKIIFNN